MPTLTGDQLAADEDAWREATVAGIKRHKQAAAGHKKRERVVQKLLVHRKRLQRKVKDAVDAAFSDEEGTVSSSAEESDEDAAASTMAPELRRLHEQHEAEQARSKEAARSYRKAHRALQGVQPVASIDSHDPAVALLAFAEQAVHCSQAMIVRCGPNVAGSASSHGDSGEPRRAKRVRQDDDQSAAGGQSGATGGSGLTSKEARRRGAAGKQADAAAERGEFTRMHMLKWYRGHIQQHAAEIRQTRLDLLAWWSAHPLHALVLFVATQTRTPVYNHTSGSPDSRGVSPTKQWERALAATLESADILDKMDVYIGEIGSGAVVEDTEAWDDQSAQWDDVIEAARGDYGAETSRLAPASAMAALAEALSFDAGSIAHSLDYPLEPGRSDVVGVLRHYINEAHSKHAHEVDACYDKLLAACQGELVDRMTEARDSYSARAPESFMLRAVVAGMDNTNPEELDRIRRVILEYLVPAQDSLEALKREIEEESAEQTDLAATEARLNADMSLNFAIVGVARGVYTALLNRFEHLRDPNFVLDHHWGAMFSSYSDVFASLVAMQVCLNDRTSSMRPSYKGDDNILVKQMYELSFYFHKARLVKRRNASGMEHLYLEGGSAGSAERQTWSLTSLAHRRAVMERTRLYVTQ